MKNIDILLENSVIVIINLIDAHSREITSHEMGLKIGGNVYQLNGFPFHGDVTETIEKPSLYDFMSVCRNNEYILSDEKNLDITSIDDDYTEDDLKDAQI